MVTHDCDTCHGHGEVMTMVPGHTGEPVEDTIDCPDCEGYGSYQTPDLFERLVGLHRANRVRAPINRARRRAEWARARWAERDASTVAATVAAHRNLIDDEPMLRHVVEHQLIEQLTGVTPLRWRQADLRWCRDNAKRALRGLPMLPVPYEEQTSVTVNTEGREFFERNMAALRAERRRVPRA